MGRHIVCLVAFGLIALLASSHQPLHAAAGMPPSARAPRSGFAESQASRFQGAPCAAAAATDPTVVATTYGAVRGVQQGGVLAFKGVPYAAPPVGDLRWHDPVPPGCWPDVRDASAFGNMCQQLRGGSAVGDEDCLTLNVWTPQPASGGGPLPVMFFLPGGGNVEGSTADQVNGAYSYDGAVLAQKGNAIVVTVNYRLGVFGFLADPDLTAAPDQTVHGNYGIMDQIAALSWVQQNISSFGGDPARVLLFGQSAGANDTCILVATPLAAGLFSSALMESGTCVEASLTQRERTGVALAQKTGCDGQPDVVGCLRSLPAAALVSAIPVDVAAGLNSHTAEAYGPTVDGVLLTDTAQNLIAAGSGNHVPLIVGANADEMGVFNQKPLTADEYTSNVRKAFPSTADQVLVQYPLSQFSTARVAWVAVVSDLQYICPSRAVARSGAAGEGAPVYRYFFTHALDGGPARSLGAWHGLELRFVFGRLDNFQNYQADANEQALSDAIIGYWSRFAATGDPNGAGAVLWPQYNPAADTYLALDETVAAGQGVHTAKCDFWQNLASVPAPATP